MKVRACFHPTAAARANADADAPHVPETLV
jgi:hypothetical protein